MADLLFSDIHASKDAARDLEDLATRFDNLYCGGDICGYKPDFEYVIDMFQALGVKSVLGNHDRMVLEHRIDLEGFVSGVAEPIQWTREHIRGKYLDYLQSLPIEIEENGLFITHTWNFDFYIREEAHCTPLLYQTEQPIIVIGHTHIPALFDFGDRRVVNPGSITFGRRGLPRGYVVLDEGSIIFETLE